MSSKYSLASSEVSTSKMSAVFTPSAITSTVFTPPAITKPGNYCDNCDILLLEILILLLHCLIKLIAAFKQTIIKGIEVQNPHHKK